MSSEAPAGRFAASAAAPTRNGTSASGIADPVSPGRGAAGRQAAAHSRAVLGTLVGGAAVVFVWFHRQDLAPMWGQLRTASPAWLLVGVAFVGVWLVAWGLMHRAGQRAAGWTLGPWRAVRLAAAASFLNVVTKSAGVAGVAPFFGEANRQGRSRGPVLAGYASAVLGGETVFVGVLVVAVVMLVRDDRLPPAVVGGGIVFLGYLAARFALVLAATRSRAAVHRMASLPRRAVARVRGRPARVDGGPAADELYDAVQLLRAHPWSALPVLGWAVGLEVAGIAVVVAATTAVGLPIDLGHAVVIYATAVLFGIVGFLPGGLGFVELTTVAVLVSYGIPAPRAAAAIVLYRGLELWLPALAGGLAVARSPR
jgi:uncharacterized membrane protein YbhN (UPF0104 family)